MKAIALGLAVLSIVACDSLAQRRTHDIRSQLDSANAEKLGLQQQLADAQFVIATTEGDKTTAMADAERIGKRANALQLLIDEKHKELIKVEDLARKEQEGNSYTWAAILAIVTGGIQVLGNVVKKTITSGAV